MARTAQRPEFWAAVVAEVRSGELTREQVAAKHGVSVAALKYHLLREFDDRCIVRAARCAVRREIARRPIRDGYTTNEIFEWRPFEPSDLPRTGVRSGVDQVRRYRPRAIATRGRDARISSRFPWMARPASGLPLRSSVHSGRSEAGEPRYQDSHNAGTEWCSCTTVQWSPSLRSPTVRRTLGSPAFPSPSAVPQ
jgi:hypothetical protein